MTNDFVWDADFSDCLEMKEKYLLDIVMIFYDFSFHSKTKVLLAVPNFTAIIIRIGV